jgi:hypothetical protein
VKRSYILLGIVLVFALAVAAGSYLALRNSRGLQGAVSGPDEAELIYGHYNVLMEKGDIEKAGNSLEALVALYPGKRITADALKRTARYYEGEGDHAQALYYYNAALKHLDSEEERAEMRELIGSLNRRLTESSSGRTEFLEYRVQPGDSLYSIAVKFGTSVGYLKQINSLKSDLIRAGQKLKVDEASFSIYVDKNRNILVLKKGETPFKTYIVATGEKNSTPEGSFRITDKLIHPPWTRPDGKVVYPGDPEYELGARWMPINVPGYGIHGTNDESSLGRQSTAGCVRMKNEDVIELFELVPRGTPVRIVDTSAGNVTASNDNDAPGTAQTISTDGE